MRGQGFCVALWCITFVAGIIATLVLAATVADDASAMNVAAGCALAIAIVGIPYFLARSAERISELSSGPIETPFPVTQEPDPQPPRTSTPRAPFVAPGYAAPRASPQAPTMPTTARPSRMVVTPTRRDKTGAAILAFCLGSIGIHRFYLGDPRGGVGRHSLGMHNYRYNPCRNMGIR